MALIVAIVHIDGTLTGTTLRVKMDLGVMAMKWYSTLPIYGASPSDAA